MVQKEKKQSLIQEHRTHEGDTGSAEVQIAILTERISRLTDHLRINKHDYSTQRGLMMLVGQRRRLLRYLRKSNPSSYKTLIGKLNIRESSA
ncbi:MAG: 30S ribosomal protein S15 [Chloroflexi bacterium]|nr:30S ribosomal protein S15 [Chloroflexota bacterium]